MQHVKSALMTHLAALLPSFDTLAPAGTPLPYIVFQVVGGGYDNQTALDTRDELWQVKAISADHAQAHTLADAIRQALHQQVIPVAGWQLLHIVQTDQVWMVETVNRQPIYHAGGTFRIRLARQV